MYEPDKHELIYRAHPDRGGNANHAAEINAAFDEAKRFYENGGAR